MSFDLYFAGAKVKTKDDLIIKRDCNVLFSQLNDRRAIMNFIEVMDNNKLFIDSGAFSAWSKGKPINVENYIEFVNEHIDKVALFASVDNIPGELRRTPTLQEKKDSPVLSWENYLYMRELVKDKDKLLPVFHIGEDFKHLQNMLEVKLDGKHIPYIGLGGTVGLTSTVKDNWYKQCFKIIHQSNNPQVKVHAFGMTSLKILENFPFESADSTSWLMQAINGTIITEFGTISISNRTLDRPNHYNKLPYLVQRQVQEQCIKYGLTVEECMEDPDSRMNYNINYYKDWADNYEYKGNNRYQKRLF